MIQREHEYNGWKLHAHDTRVENGWHRVLVAEPPGEVPDSYIFSITVFPKSSKDGEIGVEGRVLVTTTRNPSGWTGLPVPLVEEFTRPDGYIELFFGIVDQDEQGGPELSSSVMDNDIADYLRGLVDDD